LGPQPTGWESLLWHVMCMVLENVVKQWSWRRTVWTPSVEWFHFTHQFFTSSNLLEWTEFWL